MNNPFNGSCAMIIFGGTGDLTHRKLLPAIYNLQYHNSLPPNFVVVAIGRKEKTNETYREEIYRSIKQFSKLKVEDHVWDRIRDRIFYKEVDFLQQEAYAHLNRYLEEIEEKHHTKGNRIYYMAVAPEYFEGIVDNLHRYCVDENKEKWQRIVIEKPFGRDFASAKYLNNRIVKVFKEENTYRIDHYLGKEMLQNIMVIRFANMLFEPLWNNRYIDHIQISSNETVGVENRGRYYEKAGAMRDMVQSHMLQLLSLVAMEPPNDLDPESVRDEKVKVLKALKKISSKGIREHVVLGQYGSSHEGHENIGYREEKDVDAASMTETFVALKVFVENFRWTGVPFYIRTGKRMPVKSTEIVIQFKSMENILYFKENKMDANMLIIKIQPTEGVFLQFNTKEPGTKNKIVPVQMDFCQNCQTGINSPEAYERLLYDVMRGDSTLFARWDEVEYAWKFTDRIIENWDREKLPFPNYEAGTWGPEASDILLQKDHRAWKNHL
ncbi:MAG: glucose-6-phosphate dehydrogenase [Bacillota bacterium]